MVEVNEEIVKQYLELQGYFVLTDAKFLRKKENTGKKGSGWGDVDILAIHPNGTRYLVEVKGWHMESFTPSYFGGEPYVDRLSKEKAEAVFQSNDFKTVLVVSYIGSRSREKVMELARNEGINEVWEFPMIINHLVNRVELNVDYDSEVLHMIRVLKQYMFLPSQVLQVRVPELELDLEMAKYGHVKVYGDRKMETRFTCFKRVSGEWRWLEVRNSTGTTTNQLCIPEEDKRNAIITEMQMLRTKLAEWLT